MRSAPTVGGDEPRLVKGLDGKEGLDLGNGTMKMPDGSIRSITKTGSSTVEPGPLDRTMPRGESPADRMDRAAARMEEASLRTHHTVEVQAAPGTQARTKGMTATGTGSVRPNVGVSMPAAEGTWI